MNNLGFLVVGVVQTDAQIGNSVLVPSSSSSGILGLLPSTSPYDIIDDGPTWVNFNGMKTPQVSLMGCPRFLMMRFHVWQCLYLVQAADLSCLQIRHVWWKHVRCNNLSFDLVHCGGIVFFPSPSLLRQLPENYSAFPDISGRLFLKIHSDGFAASPSACVSPIPHEVPNEGLSPVGTSSLLLHGVLSFGNHIATALKTWMMPIC